MELSGNEESAYIDGVTHRLRHMLILLLEDARDVGGTVKKEDVGQWDMPLKDTSGC